MTLKQMVLFFTTYEVSFSITLSALRREISGLAEMKKLSRKDADLHVLSYVFQYVRHGF